MWVNFLVIFLSAYSSLIIYTLINSKDGFFDTLMTAVIGSLFGILGFGFIFWVLFFLLTIMIDLILPFRNITKLNQNLLIEWFLVSLPFIFWMFKDGMFILLIGIIPYLITQFTLRKKKIVEIIQNHNQVLNSDSEELI
mgnify:CR=1 FL=1